MQQLDNATFFPRLAVNYDESGKKLQVPEGGKGREYEEFLALLGGKTTMLNIALACWMIDCMTICDVDSERVYGYVRFETGDEMSRRAKFAFITWIGPTVSPLKKAKVSTDKAFVKKIICVSIQ